VAKPACGPSKWTRSRPHLQCAARPPSPSLPLLRLSPCSHCLSMRDSGRPQRKPVNLTTRLCVSFHSLPLLWPSRPPSMAVCGRAPAASPSACGAPPYRSRRRPLTARWPMRSCVSMRTRAASSGAASCRALCSPARTALIGTSCEREVSRSAAAQGARATHAVQCHHHQTLVIFTAQCCRAVLRVHARKWFCFVLFFCSATCSDGRKL